MGNASRQNSDARSRRRLPFWVLLGISGRHSNRLGRRAAYLRVCLGIAMGVVAMTLGTLREEPDAFLFIFAGVAVWLLSAYSLVAIRWLDRKDAWRWP